MAAVVDQCTDGALRGPDRLDTVTGRADSRCLAVGQTVTGRSDQTDEHDEFVNRVGRDTCPDRCVVDGCEPRTAAVEAPRDIDTVAGVGDPVGRHAGVGLDADLRAGHPLGNIDGGLTVEAGGRPEGELLQQWGHLPLGRVCRPLTPVGVAVVCPVGVDVEHLEVPGRATVRDVDRVAVEPGVVSEVLERVVEPVAVRRREKDECVVELGCLERLVGVLVGGGVCGVAFERAGDEGGARPDQQTGERHREYDPSQSRRRGHRVGQSRARAAGDSTTGPPEGECTRGTEHRERGEQVEVVERAELTEQSVGRVTRGREDVVVAPEQEVPGRDRHEEAAE